MKNKIIKVFYGEDGYPYKDQARTVPFPLMGNSFIGSSNTTKIRFYYDELVEQDDTETAWVACAKLPNGKIGSKVLETDYDSTLGEHYALLELDSFYFQYKGDVYISLQGYQGGVQVSYDEETELYTINGTPTIAATGSIKLSVNYATQFIGSGETSNVNFQRILADLGTKLGIRAQSEHVEELPSVGQNDIFYVVNDDPNDPNLQNIYVWNENTQSYVWVGDNTLDLGNYYTKAQGEQFESGIDNRVTSIENELESVASGSPKGVYATLSDLESAYPTGTDGIYVVSADGHWYYWNGSAWTDGGIYLSSLPDDELSSSSINSIQNKAVFENINGTMRSIVDITDDTENYDTYSNVYQTSGGAIGSYNGYSIKFVKLQYGESLRVRVKNAANMYSIFLYAYAGRTESSQANQYNHKPIYRYSYNGENGTIEHFITNTFEPIIYVGVCYQTNYSGNRIVKYTPKVLPLEKYDIIEVLREHPFSDTGHYVGAAGGYPQGVSGSACSTVFEVKSTDILIIKGRVTNNVSCCGRMADSSGSSGYNMPFLSYSATSDVLDDKVVYKPTQDKEYFRLSIYPLDNSNFNYNSRAFILRPKQQAYKESNLKQELQLAGKLTYLSLLCQRALCIGDSLTEGYCAKDDASTVMNSNYSYPYFLSKLTSWYVDNAGISGITPEGWWSGQRSKYDYTKYQFFFLFLGGNGTLTDTIEEDTNNDDANYENYADTNTGRYCSIIKMIQTLNPDAKIFILNGYANVSMITKIAEHYNLPEIKLDTPTSNLLPVIGSHVPHLFNHSHPSIKGYLNMAVDVLTFVTNYIFENPDNFVMPPSPQTTWNYNIMHESNLPTEDGDYYLTVTTDGSGKRYSFTKKVA